MRARRLRKSSPIRYLLLADQKLQRISLKRISSHLKRAKPSSRSKGASHGKTFERLRTPSSTATAILLVGACVIGAAALTTARQPSLRPTGFDDRDPKPMEIGNEETTRPVMPRAEVKKAAASKPPMSVVSTRTARSEKAAATAAAAESPNLPTVSNVQALAPVTITGCLEMAKGTFRLKDTAGDAAPKSRSWKSGFLRKRTGQIELVDDARTLRLPTYVGQRVVATGTLANGEMRARSLKRVAASCD